MFRLLFKRPNTNYSGLIGSHLGDPIKEDYLAGIVEL